MTPTQYKPKPDAAPASFAAAHGSANPRRVITGIVCMGRSEYETEIAAYAYREEPGVYDELDVIEAVNATCSCGGKGPEDGCCPACEVWHRMNGRWPNIVAQR